MYYKTNITKSSKEIPKSNTNKMYYEYLSKKIENDEDYKNESIDGLRQSHARFYGKN